jgi:hypothetical protein
VTTLGYGNRNAAKHADEARTSFLHIRAHPVDKAAWVRAACARRVKLARWVTDVLNAAASGGGGEDAHPVVDGHSADDAATE